MSVQNVKDIIQDGKIRDVECATASVGDLCPTFVDTAVISSSRL
jgi:hypothetical protein